MATATATRKTKARSTKKVTTKRAIQVSLEPKLQIYYKVAALILYTDVSKLIRELVSPVAVNPCIKQILSEMPNKENAFLNLDLLETFDVDEETILTYIEALPSAERHTLLTQLIKYGEENAIDYKLLMDADKIG